MVRGTLSLASCYLGGWQVDINYTATITGKPDQAKSLFGAALRLVGMSQYKITPCAVLEEVIPPGQM